MPVTKPTLQQLVFTIEYIIDIERNMSLDLDGVLEKMQENGASNIVSVEVRGSKCA